MANVPSLTLRQMLEGMTLVFDAEAAGDLNAVIQFDVSGAEPGTYHLRIADGDCTFHLGAAENPTLTINTPSDVWLKTSSGEISGQEALMQGLYQANGDLSLMLRMDVLFSSESDGDYTAPPEQRPAGPIALPGMTWMMVAFVPWSLFWTTFDISGLALWVSVGIPFALALLLVGYRLIFDRPTWLEWGSLGFFTCAGVLSLVGNTGFPIWGSIISQLVMGALWLSSVQFSAMPLCGEYSKWGFIEKLWRTTFFIYPNVVISLMWGGQFIVAALLGMAALLTPDWFLVMTLLRYLLLVPAFIFTTRYQKGNENRAIHDVDGVLERLRSWARIGLAVIAVASLLVIFGLR